MFNLALSNSQNHWGSVLIHWSNENFCHTIAQYVFADSVTTTTPVSSPSSTHHYLQTRDKIMAEHSHWNDVIQQDLKQINQAPEDDSMLCQDHESQRNEMALLGSTPSWHEIQQQLSFWKKHINFGCTL